jgi:hypothetical protein
MRLEPGQRRECTACGKPLIGARTMGGSVAPIETEVHPQGNVLLQRHDGVLTAVTLGGRLHQLALEAGIQLRLNHFASCEDAERFRAAERSA